MQRSRLFLALVTASVIALIWGPAASAHVALLDDRVCVSVRPLFQRWRIGYRFRHVDGLWGIRDERVSAGHHEVSRCGSVRPGEQPECRVRRQAQRMAGLVAAPARYSQRPAWGGGPGKPIDGRRPDL